MCSEYKEELDFNTVRAIVICKWTGEFLVDLIIDKSVDSILLSGFVASLSMFADASLGKIEDISVNGVDMDMVIVTNGELIAVVMMDKTYLKERVREEVKNLLEAFTIMYRDDLYANSCNSEQFSNFSNVIMSHIHQFGKKQFLMPKDMVAGI